MAPPALRANGAALTICRRISFPGAPPGRFLGIETPSGWHVPDAPLDNDASNGWETVAAALIERRDQSHIGVSIVRSWAGTLPRHASILDLGCGSGVPISKTLIDAGFIVAGIDASPSMVAAFRDRFPRVRVSCEAAETSQFFGRTFDAVVAVGLIFLLSAAAQKALLVKIGAALHSGGRLLFTAPTQACTWVDVMTGRQSHSLGVSTYVATLSKAGMALTAQYTDEGENHYYDAIRQ